MKKKAKKESGETTRDSVKKEMAMSRIAESRREAASKATRCHDTRKTTAEETLRDTDLS